MLHETLSILTRKQFIEIVKGRDAEEILAELFYFFDIHGDDVL